MLLFAVGQQAGGRKTLSMLLLLLFLQLPGLQGLETSDGVTEPKVNGFTLARITSNINLAYLGFHVGQFGQRIAAMIKLTHPKPKVLGLRLTEVDGKNFYTEEGILSLETGASASIQVSLTSDIGDITNSQQYWRYHTFLTDCTAGSWCGDIR